MGPASVSDRLVSLAANGGVALLYGTFATTHLRAFLERPRASVGLIVGLETLFVAFLLARRPARATARAAWPWAITAIAMLLPFLVRPTDALEDAAAGQALQVLGAALGIAAVASLNRSVGLLPANRGVRTRGAYALVRHPLYAAYTLANAGYLASNLGAWNAAVCAAALAAQVLRIRAEEELLLRDPAYVAYASRIRWRLVPYVF